MVQVSIFPQGTRVRIRKGSFPMNPGLVGRVGTVLRHDPKPRPPKVFVQLDGESGVHALVDEELEMVAPGADVDEAG
ncbi:MAG: hypothetical protein EA352_05550 [Gemmatimonadales bacterium]|nr:MAG: hypothetical protein EA352_05550 [Gemmatimonadales bacterium]